MTTPILRTQSELGSARFIDDVCRVYRKYDKENGRGYPGFSAYVAVAAKAVELYGAGEDTNRFAEERASASGLSEILFDYLSDQSRLSPEEVETIGNLAGMLAVASEASPRTWVKEDMTKYTDMLSDISSEALARTNVRLFY